MAKNQKSEESTQAQEEAAAVVQPAPNPDASFYVVQPTEYPIPDRLAVQGDMPEGRFTEEVLKGSDEENSGTSSEEAHPPENRPVYGVTEEGQPDTTGRMSHLRGKK